MSRAATARPSRSVPGPQGLLDHSDRIGHWAARRDQLGGGVLFSHGCHYIDLIQWYLDALPVKVAMVGTRRGTDWLEGEGTAHAVLEFPDGVLASYDCSWGMRHTVLNGIHIHCPEALLVSNYTTIEVVRGREREEVFPPPPPRRDAARLGHARRDQPLPRLHRARPNPAHGRPRRPEVAANDLAALRAERLGRALTTVFRCPSLSACPDGTPFATDRLNISILSCVANLAVRLVVPPTGQRDTLPKQSWVPKALTGSP